MEIGNREGEVSAYCILAGVRYLLHDYQMAKIYVKKQIFISTEIGYRMQQAETFLAKARILQHGKQNKAVECIEKALSIISAIGDIRGDFEALLHLSRIKMLQSKFQEVKSHLYECIAKYDKIATFPARKRAVSSISFRTWWKFSIQDA